jgi:hypothetical protein
MEKVVLPEMIKSNEPEVEHRWKWLNNGTNLLWQRRVAAKLNRRQDKHNTAYSIECFVTSTRNQVDIQRLAAELIWVGQETMQPEQISLWVKESSSRRSFSPSQDSGSHYGIWILT